MMRSCCLFDLSEPASLYNLYITQIKQITPPSIPNASPKYHIIQIKIEALWSQFCLEYKTRGSTR